MDKISSGLDFVKQQAEDNKEVTLGLAAVGALYLAGNLLSKMNLFYRYMLRPGYDLKKRYGDGWAVITGASDGIGKAYAFELAKRGFKVGLVARNQEKLDNVGKEITETHGVEAKTVVFDFDGLYTEEKVNELKEKLGVFDKVSMLINNVGIFYQESFNEYAEEKIHSMINIFVTGFTLVTKILLPKLLGNETRGGIINIGSATITRKFHKMNVKASAKAYIEMLSKSIAAEYPDKLDVLLVLVGPTLTKLGVAPNSFKTTPENLVCHTLGQLGKETITYGVPKQRFKYYLMDTMIIGPLLIAYDKRQRAPVMAARKQANK